MSANARRAKMDAFPKLFLTRKAGIFLLTILFLVLGVQGLAQTSQAPPVEKPALQVGSEVAIESVDLQRTGVYHTKGIPHVNGLLWKSGNLFDTHSSKMITPTFDGSLELHLLGFSDPVIAHGLIYFRFSIRQGYLLALDAATGEVKWHFEVAQQLLSSPSVADGSVYVGTASGDFYALQALTGQERWRFKSDNRGNGFSSPAISDGVVYCGRYRGNVYAIDAETGEAKWTFKKAGMSTSPAIANGIIYFGAENGYLYALDIKTGQEVWDFKVKGEPGTPMVAGEAVYFGTSEGDLYAVHAQKGQQKWKTKIGEKLGTYLGLHPVEARTSLAFAEKTIYYGYAKNLYAIDAGTGQQKWVFKLESFARSPVIADGMVYFGSLGKLYGVDALTGQRIWALENKVEIKKITQSYVASSPAVADGVAYFVSENGYAYAVH
jgi:outer membrane protein assembly factor BamB